MKFSVTPEAIVPRGQDAGLGNVVRLAGELGMKVLRLGRTTVVLEGDDRQLDELVRELPGWIVEPVQTTNDDDPLEATLRYLRTIGSKPQR